jgi:hypothetical protein
VCSWTFLKAYSKTFWRLAVMKPSVKRLPFFAWSKSITEWLATAFGNCFNLLHILIPCYRNLISTCPTHLPITLPVIQIFNSGLVRHSVHIAHSHVTQNQNLFLNRTSDIFRNITDSVSVKLKYTGYVRIWNISPQIFSKIVTTPIIVIVTDV